MRNKVLNHGLNLVAGVVIVEIIQLLKIDAAEQIPVKRRLHLLIGFGLQISSCPLIRFQMPALFRSYRVQIVPWSLFSEKLISPVSRSAASPLLLGTHLL